MLARIVGSFLLSLLINYSFAQPLLPENVQHLQIKRLNDSFIDTYIYNKHPDQKLPLLIFCQGSGYDSNTKGFLGLAAQFGEKAAGLVLEKQGVKYDDKGDSLTKIYKENNLVHNRLYDYLRVLEYLRKKATWWNGDIYIIGGSEGGLIAGMLASFYPDTKAVAIMSFGGGLTFGEAWPLSTGLQKKAEGADVNAIFKEQLLAKDSINLALKEPLTSKSYSGNDNTYAWWASIANLRLENVLLDLDIPIFIGQGTEDIMAPPISAKRLEEVFKREKKKNLLLKEYKGYDHSFIDKEKKSHLVEVFREAITWLLDKK